MKSIGARIRIARDRAGLTQAELAEKCGWSGGQRRTSHYESDRSTPSYEDMAIMARVLGTSSAYLAFGEVTERDPFFEELNPQLREIGVHWLDEAGVQFGKRFPVSDSLFSEANVDPEAAAWFSFEDNSHDPLMPPGTIALVNTADTRVVSGKPYVIEYGGLELVRFVYELPNGAFRLRCYNQHEWPDEVISSEAADDFHIFGRVFSYIVKV